MNIPSFSELTHAAIHAALLGGEILQKGFHTAFPSFFKEGKHNIVTEYDLASEKAIYSFLRQKFPTHSFLAEEMGLQGSAEDSVEWVIDPLDGTMNFAHHIPVFSVSIAAKKKGQIFCGVIYQPMVHELFVAERQKGAFLNGKKLEVSSTSSIDKAMLTTGFPFNVEEDPHQCIERFTQVIRLGLPVRRMGSAALDLAYVAAGRFDGYWETQLGPWDCAAGALLVEEAKGKVTDWEGSPFILQKKNSIFASNGKLHPAMAKIMGFPESKFSLKGS